MPTKKLCQYKEEGTRQEEEKEGDRI